MEQKILEALDRSLERCTSRPGFFDRFYEKFLASSPKVREKFTNTDFVHQKRALKASLQMILLAAEDPEKGPARYLSEIAEQHSARDLDIGAELYDLWLDSLLTTVREVDPLWSPEVEQAWEGVMTVGIAYLVSRYNRPPAGT